MAAIPRIGEPTDVIGFEEIAIFVLGRSSCLLEMAEALLKETCTTLGKMTHVGCYLRFLARRPDELFCSMTYSGFSTKYHSE
jgi:hypothetical protein